MAYALPKWTVFDWETEAIRARPEYPPKPVGLAVKRPGERKGRYYAFGHPTGNNCTKEEAFGVIRDIANNTNEPMLFQEAKFDIEVACKHVPRFRMPRWDRIHDTKYMLFLRNPHSTSLALKPSYEALFGVAPDEQDELKAWIIKNVKGARAGNWGEFIALAPGAITGKYAIGDVWRTDGIGKLLLPYIHKHDMMDAYDRERHLMPILLRNEQEGIRTDLEALGTDIPRMLQDIETCDSYLRKRLRKKDLNISSDAEFGEALSDAGMVRDEDWKLTKTGKRSTSKKNLTPDMFKDVKVFQAFSHRNKLSTCVTTFAQPWYEQAQATGGTIHTIWRQVKGSSGGNDAGGGARSGRMQCVAGDTPILTSNGLIPIDNVKVGDMVLTHKHRWRPVTNTCTKGLENMYTVHFANGQKLTCTMNHRLLVYIYESFNEVVHQSGKYSKSAEDVQGAEWAGFREDSRKAGYPLPQCPVYCAEPHTKGRTADIESAAVRAIQSGREECDVRPKVREASKVAGGMYRFERLCDIIERWPQAACPSYSNAESVGFEEATAELASASYRSKPVQQQFGQSGSSDKFWPQGHSHHDETGECWTTITQVTPREVRTVFDITVAEDESYAACGVFSHNSSPNFQNIPKNFNKKDPNYSKPTHLDVIDLPLMRRYLIADNPKHLWGRRDFNQQEIRILGHFESGSLMANYLRDPRYDMHQLVHDGVLEIVGVDFERDRIKAFNFQDIYGGGIPAFCESLGCDYATAMRVKKAKAALMPDVQALREDIEAEARKGNPIRTWGDREYHVEESKYVEKHKRVMDFFYKLLNYLIQGSAADCTKEALIRYDEHPKREGRMLVAVHDEINTSVEKKLIKHEMAVLKEVMQSIEFDVPMLSDGETGPSWGNLEKFTDKKMDLTWRPRC